MELKQIIFIGLTLMFVPTAAWFGITYRWAEKLLVVAAFFSTCYLIDINIVSMEHYRGDARGFEFGTTDWVMMALALVMSFSPRWKDKRPQWWVPNSVPLMAYFLLAAMSIFAAAVPLYGGFGLFKIMRALLVYWVAYNYLRSEEDLRFVVLILAGIVAFEFMQVMLQRFSGVYRAFGTLPHSNTLALYINMMNMIFLSFVLNDKNARRWERLVHWAALGMGSLIVLATFSRGALAVMVLCYGIVVMFSLWDRVRGMKVRTIAVMGLLALMVAIKVAPSVIYRFQNAPEESGESRHQANDAAIAMANSNWLGIGLNNYSCNINETGFSRFIPSELDRGIVHNIYLLHAAEMGWAGLGVFLLVILNFLWMAMRLIFRRLDNIVSWVAIGIFAGMTSLWVQSGLEWAFRQTYISIEFFMLAGFLAALPRVLANERLQKRRKARRRAQFVLALQQRQRQLATR
jgi:O-antigen ligase